MWYRVSVTADVRVCPTTWFLSCRLTTGVPRPTAPFVFDSAVLYITVEPTHYCGTYSVVTLEQSAPLSPTLFSHSII